jgi:hypothetical protein
MAQDDVLGGKLNTEEGWSLLDLSWFSYGFIGVALVVGWLALQRGLTVLRKQQDLNYRK